MRVLFVTRTPFEGLTAGNIQYSASLIKVLTDMDILVDIFYLRTLTDESISVFTQLTRGDSNIYDYRLEFRPQKAKEHEGVFKVDNEVSLNLITAFEDIVNRVEYDFIIVDYIYLSILAEVVPMETQFIINTHDIHANRHLLVNPKSIKTTFSTYSVSPSDEKHALGRVDAFIAITERDVDYFSSLNPDAQPILFPFFPIQRSPDSRIRDSRSILIESDKLIVGFIGSSNLVNLAGISEFLETMNSYSPSATCSIKFVIAGSIGESIPTRLYSNLSVTLIRSLENIEDFYQNIDLVVLPLGPSTGQKIKTVEALFYYKPVLATFDALSGIHTSEENQKYIFSSIHEMCQELADISSNGLSHSEWVKDVAQYSGLIQSDYISFVDNSISRLFRTLTSLSISNKSRPLRNSSWAKRYCDSVDAQAVFINESKINYDRYSDVNRRFTKSQAQLQELQQLVPEFRFQKDLSNKTDREANMDSVHIILCVDWNGGELFFQWILTLCSYLYTKNPLCSCIVQLGPNSDINNYRSISFPGYIRVHPYSDRYFEKIIDAFPSNAFYSKTIHLYAHGWDSFSIQFFEDYSTVLDDLVQRITIYSDASKPQTSVRCLDPLHFLTNTTFDELSLFNFTPIQDAHTCTHLLAKSKYLTEDDLSRIFLRIRSIEIPNLFHSRACSEYFEFIPPNDISNLPRVDSNSALIVLRYWGMFSYKFNSESDAACAMHEQIENCLDGHETLYIKKDPRLSESVESLLLEKLSAEYRLVFFDDMLEYYSSCLKGYKLSFGLEPIFYSFPELISQFSLIYCFDGSFCYFASQLDCSSNFLVKTRLMIGADVNLPHTANASRSTIDYIIENSYSQITPFLKNGSFSVENRAYCSNSNGADKCTLHIVTSSTE